MSPSITGDLKTFVKSMDKNNKLPKGFSFQGATFASHIALDKYMLAQGDGLSEADLRLLEAMDRVFWMRYLDLVDQNGHIDPDDALAVRPLGWKCPCVSNSPIDCDIGKLLKD
jgi:hypothetical protein